MKNIEEIIFVEKSLPDGSKKISIQNQDWNTDKLLTFITNLSEEEKKRVKSLLNQKK